MKKLQTLLSIIIILAAIVPAAIPQYAANAEGELQTITIQPDENSVKDTDIRSLAPGDNFATSPINIGELNIGTSDRRRTLLEFDLSSLPRDITVDSATITLTVKADYATNAGTIDVYYVKRNWNESGATWGRYKYMTDWGDPGADGPGDIGSTPIATATTTATQAVGDEITFTITDTSAILQMVLGNYYGFMFKTAGEDNDGYQYYASNETVETRRPKIVINYYLDAEIVDVGWECYNVDLATIDAHCDWGEPATGVTSPYMHARLPLSGFQPLPGYENVKWVNAAVMLCEPHPLCVDDYPVFFEIKYWFVWTAPRDSIVTGWIDVHNNGGGHFRKSGIECNTPGSQNFKAGACSGTHTGVFQITDLADDGTNPYDFFIEAFMGYDGSVQPQFSAKLNWQITYSRIPLDQTCSETYVVPVIDTVNIVPTLETPLGPTGTPADQQIRATEIGQNYMIRTQDGPWNDGLYDRYDTQVSIDGGETWVDLITFSETALCVDVNATHPEQAAVYFTATTTSIAIRVADTAAAFADNYHNAVAPDIPINYSFGIAMTEEQTICETQFTFTEDDLFDTVDVIGNDPVGAIVGSSPSDPTSVALQIGEWYAITVVFGSWNENLEENRTDMEYSMWQNGTYEDLALGGTYVQCVSANGLTVYVQAARENMFLRVNDQDEPQNWSDNLGFLTVNIYHAAYNYIPAACELEYHLNDLVASGDFQANMQPDGVQWAFALGSGYIPQTNFTGSLTPGAWYAIETTGGPWKWKLSSSSPGWAESWETQIADGDYPGPPTEGQWADFDAFGECNVELDAIGHRRAYFQVPITAVGSYSIRADNFADATIFESGMGWQLWSAEDNGGVGGCDYHYSEEDKISTAPQIVDGQAIDGELILQLDANHNYYVVKILTGSHKWKDSAEGADEIAMQMSLNNGQTWSDLSTTAGILCVLTAENGDQVIFFRTGDTQPLYKLRVDSADDSWQNNSGEVWFDVYAVDAGNIQGNCTSGPYNPNDIVFNGKEPIPVKDEPGTYLRSIKIQTLETGKKYTLLTSMGPWVDGPETGVQAEKYDAEISADNGETWGPLDGTNTNLSCWEVSTDMHYRKVEFTVADGQQWKVRVMDEAGDFANNDGSLYYTLIGVEVAGPPITPPPFNTMSCDVAAIIPSLSTIDSFGSLGVYVGAWFDYLVASIVKFFAWCPEHTEAMMYFGEQVKTREPFAMIDEFETSIDDIETELNGYNWGANADGQELVNQDYSIFSKSPGEAADMVDEFFTVMEPDSPWMGNAPIVNFDDAASYTFPDTCGLALEPYVGPLLTKGVCFSTNWATQTGMMFYIQMLLDVGIAFTCIHSVMGSFKSLVYLFTGVNLEVRNSDAKVFVNTIGDFEESRRAAQVDEQTRQINEATLRELEQFNRSRRR